MAKERMKGMRGALVAALAVGGLAGGTAVYVANNPEAYLSVREAVRDTKIINGSSIFGDTDKFISGNADFISEMSGVYGIRKEGLEELIRREIGPENESGLFGFGKYDEQMLKAWFNNFRSELGLRGDYAEKTGRYLGHSQGLLNEKAGLLVPRLVARIKNPDLKKEVEALVDPNDGSINELGLARLVNNNHEYAIELAAAHISLFAPAIEAYCKDHPGEDPALWQSMVMGWFAGDNNGILLQKLVNEGYLSECWGYYDKGVVTCPHTQNPSKNRSKIDMTEYRLGLADYRLKSIKPEADAGT